MKKIISIVLVVIVLFTLSFGSISASAAVGDNRMTEIEPNNTMSSADRIYNDYTVNGVVRAGSSDMDYFKFTLYSTTMVDVLCVSKYSSLLMGIWNSSEKCVAAATYLGYSDGNATFSITKTLSAGTYYLVLFDEDDYGNNIYTYHIEYATSTHTHSYYSSVVNPTCVAQGYTQYTCSCGATYNGNYTSPTGKHTYSSAESISAQKHIAYCTVCYDYIEESHIYTDLIDTTCNKCDSTRAAYTGTTLTKNSNGEWIYIKNGSYSNETTLVKYNNEWWYVKNGKLCKDNTLVKYNGTWYHVKDGKLVRDTAVVEYSGTGYYVKNGVLNSNANGLVKTSDSDWYYLSAGKVVKKTGLISYNGSWWYIKNGKLCKDNTLVKYNGVWYHVNGGKWVKDTTLVKYNNVWYYVVGGKLNNANTLCSYGGKLYHVNGGKMVKDTTLVKYNNVWYYVKDGVVNNATTLVKYNNAWYAVKNGKMLTENTLISYNGSWYHVNGGKWVKDTTLVKYNNKWYYVSGGLVDFSYNGKALYNKKYYTIKDGIMVSNIAATTNVNSPTLVYQDSKVKIYFKKATSDGVYFDVQNLTSVTITIQADAIALNGHSTDRITMSDDIAPYSTGEVKARCSISGVGQVGTISGQLRVIDFGDSFDSYDAKFDTIVVNPNVKVTKPTISNKLVYSDSKVKIYYKGVNSNGVVFTVENLTNIVITIQADSVSLNGRSTDRITMSDDVAPHSVGDVVARCSLPSSVGSVNFVGGQLNIIDFNHSFSSYDASFYNIAV